jgi:hypothetical protein
LAELIGATEVFVANAVTGVLPVAGIDGVGLSWAPGPVGAMLAAELVTRPADGPVARPAWLAPLGAPVAAVPRPSPGFPDRHRVAAGRPRAGGPARPLVMLIDNYDSFTWNLAHLLYTAGAQVEVVRNDEVTAGELIGAGPDGVVISPGPCAPAEAGISIAAVTACAAAGVPLLGICLGHQAIGAAFGAGRPSRSVTTARACSPGCPHRSRPPATTR